MIINLRGDASDSGSVGHYETRFVDTVDGVTINLRNVVTNAYGVGGANADFAGQSVALIRVPHFDTLTIAAGGSLTTSSFDGAKGGVLYFRARELIVDVGGAIDLSSGGYRGAGIASNGRMGTSGESTSGQPATPPGGPPPANAGGGIGGLSDCDVYQCTSQLIGAGGGGASYATLGTAGDSNGALHTGGAEGALYGTPDLSDLFLGSGGGGGAGGVVGPAGETPGGNGGGVIVIWAGALDLNGSIITGGATGSLNNNCGARGTGGGGAGTGGTVWLGAATMTLGADTVRALGGTAQCNGGGAGGVGRVRLDFGTLNGLGGSAASIAAETATQPDPGMLDTF